MRILVGLLVLAVSAQADVVDRIDSCERNGGGSCVFDILRELAGRGGRGGDRPFSFPAGLYESKDTCYSPIFVKPLVENGKVKKLYIDNRSRDCGGRYGTFDCDESGRICGVNSLKFYINSQDELVTSEGETFRKVSE
jgi:hypothetical protein